MMFPKRKSKRGPARHMSRAARRRVLFSPRVESLEERRMLATISVDTPYDVVDNSDGVTSFREAITMANSDAFPGPDTINFDQSLQYGFIRRGFTGVNEDGDYIFPRSASTTEENRLSPFEVEPFKISSEITIDGSSVGFISIGRQRGTRGLAVHKADGVGSDGVGYSAGDPIQNSSGENIYDLPFGRVFEVTEGGVAKFQNTAIVGGFLRVRPDEPGTPQEKVGGAGILNDATVELVDSIVGSHLVADTPDPNVDNTAGMGAIAQGGGIHNAEGASMLLRNTRVGESVIDGPFLASFGLTADFYGGGDTFLDDYLGGGGSSSDARIVVNPEIRTGVAPDDSAVRISGNVAQGHGAGIYNAGNLTLEEGSTVEGNRTLKDGAGIYNAASGVVVLSDSEVIHQHALIEYGEQRGAGIFNAGIFEVEHSVIDGNISHAGGGIYSVGELRLVESTISNNRTVQSTRQGSTSGRGGGLYDAGMLTTISTSTFHGNTSGIGYTDENDEVVLGGDGEGGAIFSVGNSNLTIASSTIANNRAIQNGGGIYIADAVSSFARLHESTVAFNNVIRGLEPEPDDEKGGGIYSASEIEFRNSLIASNYAFGGPDYFLAPSGTTISLGHNLIGSNSGNNFGDAVTGSGSTDLFNKEPRLAPLGDYGGNNLTVGLHPGSPAIDAGNPVSVATEDQRGAPREAGSVQDIGAVEFILPTSMRVDTLSGVADGFYGESETSLADAIAWANVLEGADTISLSDRLIEQLQRSDQPFQIDIAETLVITDDLTIHGPGAHLLNISGGDTHRVFEVAVGVNVEITDVSIVDGYTFTSGVSDGGAGILNEGDLTLRRVVMADNFADGNVGHGHGGAIMNRVGATLLIEASTLHDNTAKTFGGAVRQRGSAEIVNSTISGNTAQVGGGIHSEGPDRLIHTTVAFNHAEGFTGGFREFDGRAEFRNSIFAQNTADSTPHDVNLALTMVNFQEVFASGNLIQTDSGDFFNDSSNPDEYDNLVNVDPMLPPLGDYGGTTPTHLLTLNSPARGQADIEFATYADQRRILRPNQPDMGAYQFIEPVLSGTVIVDSLSGTIDGDIRPGELTLAEAIFFSGGPSSITFAPELFIDSEGNPLPPQIIPIEDTLSFEHDIELIGPGVGKLVIDGSNVTDEESGLLQVASGVTVSISGIAITEYAHGYGISNSGNLRVDSLYIFGNRGGIDNSVFGQLLGHSITLDSNLENGLGNVGTAIFTNSTFSRNLRGVSNRANLHLTHTTITGNESGFVNTDGELTLENSISDRNTVSDGSNDDGTLIVVGVSLVDEYAGARPGNLIRGESRLSEFPIPIAGAPIQVPIFILEPGSAAIDVEGATTSTTTDQAGRPRDDALPDLGAYEARPYTIVNDEIIVDEFTDIVDGNYGPGRMNLREALLWHKTQPSSKIVVAQPSVPVNIELSGHFDISQSVEIVGPGSNWITFDGLNQSRHFKIDRIGNGSVELSGLSLINGRPTQDFNQTGGSILQDQFGNVDLALRDMVITDSSTNVSGGAVFFNGLGTLTVTDSIFRANSSEDVGGAVYVSTTFGALEVDRTSFIGNKAFNSGGAIYSRGEGLISNSLFAENRAANNGGAFRNFDEPFIVSNTTIFDNSTGEIGNTTQDKNGGAVHTRNLQLYHVTITENRARSYNTGQAYGGGIRAEGLVEIHNSILAGNQFLKLGSGAAQDADISVHAGREGEDNRGGLLSRYSIYEADPRDRPAHLTGDFDFGTGATNQKDVSIDELFVLDPDDKPQLADYGGPVPTIALLPSGRAVDAGSASSKPSGISGMRLTDARGEPLHDVPDVPEVPGSDSIVDIGAFEVQPFISTDFRYENLGGSQFGPSEALIYGFGFDDGNNEPEAPLFLGFEFDTGKKPFGTILTDPVFKTKYGGEGTYDFQGRFGFEFGFFVNSGSADVNFSGDVNHTIRSTGDSSAVLSSVVDVRDGGLYTVSPKLGAYADLVLELDAEVGAKGCVVGCTKQAKLLDIDFDERLEMFALNRHETDSKDRLLFTDAAGEIVAKAREDESPGFYKPSNNPASEDTPVVPAEGPLSPIFDGDIRYFGLDLEEETARIISKNKDFQVDNGNLVRDFDDAKKEEAETSNRVTAAEQELIDAEKNREKVLAAGDSAHPAAKESSITRLQGAQAKRNAAIDANLDATQKRQKLQEELKTNKNACRAAGGLDISFSQSDASLLGARANVAQTFGVPVGGECQGVSKHLGSLQVTLPDVNLVDTELNADGTLSSTTDNFERGSELDNKRQIAKTELDVAAFIPQLPLGQYSTQVGPLGLDLTTISYSIGPKISVSQDVAAAPKLDDLLYEFSACVGVSVNGQAPTRGTQCTEDSWSSVEFAEGSQVEITLLNGEEKITVQPSVEMAASFSNDIGLDLDLSGTFKAFSMSLSAFGKEIFGVDPLLNHTHRWFELDLGSIFNETFHLPVQWIAMDPFEVSFEGADGVTAATAFVTEPAEDGSGNEIPNEFAITTDIAEEGTYYFETPVFDAESGDLYQTVEVKLSNADASLVELMVLDDSLEVGEAKGVFTVTGINESLLAQRGNLQFALQISTGVDSLTVTATRSNPHEVDNSAPPVTNNAVAILQRDFDLAGAAAVMNLDIDDDGRVSPLTDGLLLVHHFDQDPLTTVDPEIADYIDNTLNRWFLEDPDDSASERQMLDVDDNGVTDLTDAELLMRYMAGYRGDAFTEGLTSVAPSTITHYIDRGRVAVSSVNDASFDLALGFTGEDVTGVPDTSNLDLPQGSSPYTPYQSDESEVHEFSLTNFGSQATFEELMFDDESGNAVVVSSVPLGSPHDHESEYDDVLDHDSDKLRAKEVDYQLGTDKPLYLQVPDAVGYTFESSHPFRELIIDRRIGANTLLPTDFDLYLQNDSGAWIFDSTISAESTDSLIRHSFTTPVGRFRIFSHALPNTSLHSEDNQLAAEQAAESTFTVGLVLESSDGMPNVSLTQVITETTVAPRNLITTPDAIVGAGPANMSVTSTQNHFRLARIPGTADVQPSINGGPLPLIQMTTVDRIEFVGHDNADDTLTLDSSGGPLHAPLWFEGGFRNNSLIIDGDSGSGLTIDMANRDNLRNIATIDLRGSGRNRLVLGLQSVLDNDPFGKQLTVLADLAGASNIEDAIEVDAGWVLFESVGGFDVYRNGEATLRVTAGASVVIRPPSEGNSQGSGSSGAFSSSEFEGSGQDKSKFAPDTNGDGVVTPLDALLVINYLNNPSLGKWQEFVSSDYQPDVSRDGRVTPIDALLVINRLNQPEQNTTLSSRTYRDPQVSVQVSFAAEPGQDKSDSKTATFASSFSSMSSDTIQRIASASSFYDVSANTPITIPFSYQALDSSQTTGVHLRMHYDSSQLTFVGLSDVFASSFASAELLYDGPFEDEADGSRTFAAGFDGDSATDSYVNVLWFDPEGTWDASIETLFAAEFLPTEEFSGQTSIRFTGNAADGYTLDAPSIELGDLATIVGPVQFGDGTHQRSKIDQIAVTLEGAVEIDSDAFVLTKRGASGGMVDTTFTSELDSSGNTLVTIKFDSFIRGSFNALVDGNYQLDIWGDRIRRSDTTLRLDADGDGLPGGIRSIGTQASDRFFALYGDTDGDRDVDGADFTVFRSTFFNADNYLPFLDFDGDADVDGPDFTEFRNRFFVPFKFE